MALVANYFPFLYHRDRLTMLILHGAALLNRPCGYLCDK